MRVSITMPYWKRERALQRTLDSFACLYGSQIEVVIAVDGCEPPTLPNYPFPVKIELMPKKDSAMNPCLPRNVAAQAASYPVICLTDPETWHPSDILSKMVEAVTEADIYCLSGVRDITGRWLQHSVHANWKVHWLSVLRAELFWKIGGFSQEYREGVAWEDNDFVRKLERHAARFAYFDEPHAIHDSAAQGGNIWGNWDRNKALYEEKWGITNHQSPDLKRL